MNPFSYTRAGSHDEAVGLLKDKRYSLPVLKAGGMDLLDHMKEGLSEPDLLIDVRGLRSGGRGGRGGEVREQGGRVHIEAAATLAEIAGSAVVNRRAPVVGAACGSAATPQVRNVASAAGNLLQRPRCWYYRSRVFDCLKKGGSRCYAADGENENHAIFGKGPCHIVHPSNLAVALHVCDATVHLTGSDRDSVKVRDLYHMPDRGIFDEHNLAPTEVVTHMSFEAASHSGFCSLKAKRSFDWPMVMAAVALEIDGGRIGSARVCAGAVAPVPWGLDGVAKALTGLRVDDVRGIAAACEKSVAGADPMRDNGAKVTLLPVCVRRAVEQAIGVWEA